MRFLLAVLLGILAGETLADLYRWVDPETGSVKFSNYPPPWLGDEDEEKRAPKVERIPERKGGAAPPAEATPGAAGNSLEALEERRKRIMLQLAALPNQPDFRRGGGNLKQQLDAYAAVTTEIDRLDPRGADRRRAEAQPLLEKLVEGLRSQIKPAPLVK